MIGACKHGHDRPKLPLGREQEREPTFPGLETKDILAQHALQRLAMAIPGHPHETPRGKRQPASPILELPEIVGESVGRTHHNWYNRTT